MYVQIFKYNFLIQLTFQSHSFHEKEWFYDAFHSVTLNISKEKKRKYYWYIIFLLIIIYFHMKNSYLESRLEDSAISRNKINIHYFNNPKYVFNFSISYFKVIHFSQLLLIIKYLPIAA